MFSESNSRAPGASVPVPLPPLPEEIKRRVLGQFLDSRKEQPIELTPSVIAKQIGLNLLRELFQLTPYLDELVKQGFLHRLEAWGVPHAECYEPLYSIKVENDGHRKFVQLLYELTA